MKKRISSILFNQYFISFIISLVIIFLLPNVFSKYLIELKEQDILSRQSARVYFQDLNNDNTDEKIYGYINDAGNASFEVHNDNKELLGQWNYLFKFPKDIGDLFFLDANNNGYKEIYTVTKKKDSLFLNIIEPLLEGGIDKKNIFIDVMAEYGGVFETRIGNFNLVENKNHTEQNIYFNINSGFSSYPRNIYKLNLQQNKIIKSAHLTNYNSIYNIVNLDKEETSFIITKSNAACNKIDTTYTKRSDCSSWLTVLDDNLNFLFEPIEFENPYFTLNSFYYDSNGKDFIVCLANSRRDKEFPDKINVYTKKGELLNEIILPSGYYLMFPEIVKNKIVLFNRDNGEVRILNSNFKRINQLKLNHTWALFEIDFEGDGINEWINISKNYKSFSIYQNNFTDPVNFDIPLNYDEFFRYGIKKQNLVGTELYFQKGNEYFVYNYSKNPLYYFKYFLYIGIYLVILGLSRLILKGQEIRNKNKQAIENEIAQLQIKTIKNQVDPHFVFNAINTMSEMMLTDDKLAADDFICKFSDLMRKTLKGSDKISHTLKEELDYVENFIQLQQIRFNNSFSYKFSIDKRVNVENIVPKHVLYCYVENAIKHGLSKINNGGVLKIDAIESDKRLKLTIENNGGGIEGAKKYKKNSTGNGILIMEKIYDLYFKLYRKKITYKLIEVKTKLGLNDGVKIEILISK